MYPAFLLEYNLDLWCLYPVDEDIDPVLNLMEMGYQVGSS